jgi:hypothetical protein
MPAPTVSPNDLTRQQLDELDALLQRMLSLPLNKPAEPAPRTPEPPPRPVPARTDPPASAPTPHLTIPARSEPVVAAATISAPAVAEMRSFTPPAPKAIEFPSPEKLFASRPEPVIAAPTTIPSFSLPPAVEDDPEPVALAPVTEPVTTPRLPMSHYPLVGVNWTIERLLGLFGPPGQALCSPVGKTVLGWGGVVLILGAGAWAARGMGWVHFDWPR